MSYLEISVHFRTRVRKRPTLSELSFSAVMAAFNSAKALNGMLLGFVVGGHLCKTLIGNLSGDIVLVEPLDDVVQFGNTCL